MNWDPHITVATVVEQDGRFLMVEEDVGDGGLVLNQPAGHLEANESLIQAAQRETLEETAWHVDITAFLGVALYTANSNGVTYYRSSFIATAVREDLGRELDEGIHRALWMSYQDILDNVDRLRSPLVIKTIDQYLAGHRYPLELIYGE